MRHLCLVLCCVFAMCSKKQVSVIVEPDKPDKVVQVKPIEENWPEEPTPVKASLQPITVYFDLDSYKIRPSEEVRLQQVAIDVGSKRVIVSGYACPLGSDIYNLELSRSRAHAVAQFFENHSARGYGETDLVSRETSEYWKNRRVEVRVE